MTDQLVAVHDGVDATPTALVTKIAVVIRDDLPMWQKLNMTAFLASGVAAVAPEFIGGADYADARQPLFRRSGRALDQTWHVISRQWPIGQTVATTNEIWPRRMRIDTQCSRRYGG